MPRSYRVFERLPGARPLLPRLTLAMAVPQATTHTPRAAIAALPELVVNQIAAGEVIERPASVVKELVENALDAGASRIDVELESGGIDLIRVRDDGFGIPPGELPLALATHATSKLRETGDLDRIGTLGFRGEALASIASVAQVSIVSRTRDAQAAHAIDAEQGRLSTVRPASGAPGTSITVRTLFHSTPARRKFLRTPTTEATRCLDWLTDLAMAHPHVAFRATTDGRVRLDLAPADSPRVRALELLGPELEGQLVEVHWDALDDDRGLAIWGLAGLPSLARATAKAQHVFLNGRALRDKTVQHAMREAYRGLIEPGRHPTALLMLEMPPAAVDVNVHPAKLEVRFRDQSMVHRAVYQAVQRALRSADLTPGALDRAPALGGGVPSATRSMPGATEILPGPPRDAYQTLAPGGAARVVGGRGAPGVAPYASFVEALSAPAGNNAEPGPGARAWSPRRVERVLQVHDSYLVVEDAEGIVLIDQHALHERVMFEKLLARVTAGPLESQGLLAPAPVPATAQQVDRLAELGPLLTRIGIEAEPLGPRTIGVRGVPTLLVERGVDAAELFAELLARLDDSSATPGEEEALHEVLDTMACKSAVKAGDPLTDDEIAELLEQRERVERSGSCPHGRATTVRLTRKDLDRLFDRR
ncbi:MAG: DNA mismatch repair endonuclease MutL [Planctomycetota bacterium]